MVHPRRCRGKSGARAFARGGENKSNGFPNTPASGWTIGSATWAIGAFRANVSGACRCRFTWTTTANWEVIASRAELRERAVEPEKVDTLPELHRPWIDEIEIWNKERTKTMRRVPEVGDAWLDAGIVPFSTVGYNGADDIRMPELKIAGKEAIGNRRISSPKCANKCVCGSFRCCL